MRLPTLFIPLSLLLAPIPGLAATAPDLSGRIVLDGFTSDFTPGESVFGLAADGQAMESSSDSKWQNNDVSQIRVSWDHRFVYLGVEGIIWGNNIVLLMDVFEDRGLTSMTALNSWRRNVVFAPEYAPELFLATWDTNTWPRLLIHLSGQMVSDNLPGPLFAATASFNQGAPNRAMEARLPWGTLFAGATRDTVLGGGGVADTATVLPPGAELRLVALVTGSWDGSGGPDLAPNNLHGLVADGNSQVLIDNFAIVPLDVDLDGLADIGVEPGSRVTFHDVSTPARASSWGRLKTLGR